MTQDMNKCLFGERLPKQCYLTVWVELHDDAAVAGDNVEAETDLVITAPWWCQYSRCRGTSREHVLYHIPSLSLSSSMCSCCGDRDWQILQPIIRCVVVTNARGYMTLLNRRCVFQALIIQVGYDSRNLSNSYWSILEQLYVPFTVMWWSVTSFIMHQNLDISMTMCLKKRVLGKNYTQILGN
jgi:hypothetical protein